MIYGWTVAEDKWEKIFNAVHKVIYSAGVYV